VIIWSVIWFAFVFIVAAVLIGLIGVERFRK